MVPKYPVVALNQFLSDAGAALAAAGIIAGVVWLFTKVRSYRLETALAGALSTNGVGTGYDGRKETAAFQVQVSNYSSATIRVRAFVLITDSFPISLYPGASEAKSQNPLDNAILQPKFRRLALVRGTIPDDKIDGSMLLPPMTLGWWRVHQGVIGLRSVEAKHALMVFEYPSLFGHSILVRIKIDGERFKLIKETFERLNNCALHGLPMPPPGAPAA